MAKQTKEWNIKSGPSKYDWQEALFHRKHPGAEVEMTLQEEKGEEAIVRKIKISIIGKGGRFSSAEDRSDPQNWTFFGEKVEMAGTGHYAGKDTFVIGQYSTRTREGFLKEVPHTVYEQLKKIGLL